MSRSSSMSQLLKGIIIGVVLIMAIIGTMSLLENGNPITSILSNHAPSTTTASNPPSIEAPSITVNSSNPQAINQNQDNTNIGDLNAEFSNGNINDNTNQQALNGEKTNNNSAELALSTEQDKPVLEDEKTPEEMEQVPVDFGTMIITSIDPNDNSDVKANYTVYDEDNKKVMESKNVSEAVYRLPVGQYKVETTLNQIDATTQEVKPVVTKNRYAIVRKDSNSTYVFELETPSNTGVLQVSAKIADQTIRADFVIQKANGEVIASRNNVASSLFKLDSGTYKVTVTNGGNSDFKSVEIKGGESLQTVFNLKQNAQQGRLIVKLLSTSSNRPIRGDITISSQDNTVIQALKASTQAELSLFQGNYKIKIDGPNGVSNKNIRVTPGQTLNEVFRFDTPDTNTIALNDDSQNTDNTTIIKPVEGQQTNELNGTNNSTEISNTEAEFPRLETPELNNSDVENLVSERPSIEASQTENGIENSQPENPELANTEPQSTVSDINNNGLASLNVLARDGNTRNPIRSNIYIQTLQGQHIENKTYVESGTFNLAPGTYKVTVRATNRENLVKTIRVEGNKSISETFSLVDPSNPSSQAQATSSPQNVEIRRPSANVEIRRPSQENINNIEVRRPAPTNFENNPNAIEAGFLNVSMRAPRNLRPADTNLNTHFIVNTTSGQKIVELNDVRKGDFKLDVGAYDVTAIYQNQRRTQRINIQANQNTRLVFRTTDFQTSPPPAPIAATPKGILRSQIISQSGQPLIGNLIVRNLQGQVVAQRNNVSSAVFELPPTGHTINLNYQGLTASEQIKINLNETTVQTFTIATN